MLRLPELQDLAQAKRFEFIEHLMVGQDIRLRARDASRWAALANAVSA
jgi:diaminohydroxyphosphoribosylaminopyrimidine deaminase/5-amino-6-(5-phosphoribosylamino)uracil reductase